MSIASYSDLQTAISSWLHRSDLSSYTSDFITLGEGRINSRLRVQAMETSTTVAATSAALPSDYIELKDAYISSTSPYYHLERKSAEWIYLKYPDRSSTGIPKFIAREASSFIFGPAPDSAYSIKLVYYKHFAALSGATNTIFTSYPGLYLFAALAESAPFLKDDKRVVLWEAKFEELLKQVQQEDDTEDFSGSLLRMTPG